MKMKIGVGVIGPGFIGGEFIKQIASQASSLESKYGLRLQLNGVSNSRRMLVKPEGIDPTSWKEAFDVQAETCELDGFFERLMGVPGCHHVVVDSTSSEIIPNHYTKWLLEGCHVITPNKKLGSGPYDRYTAAIKAAAAAESHFYYESTVGAGLPVLSSLQALIDTGDRVKKIDGVFSGTLSYIFNSLSKEKSFSQVVQDAKQKGFTEPDPRDDLSGLDVARKVVVLARECGMNISLEDLQIQSLVPEELKTADSADIFMERLPEFDGEILKQVMEAESDGAVLRYVGVVDPDHGKCQVALERYPKDHALAQLSGTDNMVCFSTERYSPLPLIVRGPGAGASVTAMGVFSDLLSLAKRLPPLSS